MSPFFAPSASNLGLAQSAESARMHLDALEVHNCSVYLERMDLREELLLMTVCNHSFHLDCLLQWQALPCPVCRYDHSGLNEALSQCHVCGTTESVYVCLICGVVSCGGGPSYSVNLSVSHETPNNTGTQPLSHAHQHYDETLHAYALDMETQHVWDFAGQGYVHWLLQNFKDDKLVEVNDPHNTLQEQSSILEPQPQ